MNTWEVPGKIFITGEYAVLLGAPAVVAALQPTYTSSNGKIIKPGLGAGFGSSVAEWISLQPNLDRPSALWRKYQADAINRAHADKIPDDQYIAPSGADLLAQTLGGIVCVQKGDSDAIKSSPQWLKYFYLLKPKTMTKEKTYLNLRQPKVLNWFKSPSMKAIREKWIQVSEKNLAAWKSENVSEMCEAIAEYAELAKQCDFASPDSVKHCEVIYDIPGVLAVKGCGAAFHDVFLVVSPTKVPNHPEYENLGSIQDLLSVKGARVCL